MLSLRTQVAFALSLLVAPSGFALGGKRPHRVKSHTPVHSSGAAPWSEMVQEAAERHRVPSALVESVIAAESGGRPEAVSHAGAKGLMQVMPGTEREFQGSREVRRKGKLAANIDSGTRYLAHLLKRYHQRPDGVRCALAAYNAGPTRVARYGGVPPFRETIVYVNRVLANLQQRMGDDAEKHLLASAL